MLSTNPNTRPSASDILNIPLMKVRLEEKEIKIKYEQLKRRQEYLKYKQEEYKEKIKALENFPLDPLETIKKTTMIKQSNRGRSFKSLTILT